MQSALKPTLKQALFYVAFKSKMRVIEEYCAADETMMLRCCYCGRWLIRNAAAVDGVVGLCRDKGVFHTEGDRGIPPQCKRAYRGEYRFIRVGMDGIE